MCLMTHLYGFVGNNGIGKWDYLGLFHPGLGPLPTAPPPVAPAAAGSRLGPVGLLAGLLVTDILLAIEVIEGINDLNDTLEETERLKEELRKSKRRLRELEIEKGIERRAYKTRCTEKADPGLEGCDLICWELAKAKNCLKGRQDFANKWGSGDTPEEIADHERQITQEENRIKNFEEKADEENCCCDE